MINKETLESILEIAVDQASEIKVKENLAKIKKDPKIKKLLELEKEKKSAKITLQNYEKQLDKIQKQMDDIEDKMYERDEDIIDDEQTDLIADLEEEYGVAIEVNRNSTLKFTQSREYDGINPSKLRLIKNQIKIKYLTEDEIDAEAIIKEIVSKLVK